MFVFVSVYVCVYLLNTISICLYPWITHHTLYYTIIQQNAKIQIRINIIINTPMKSYQKYLFRLILVELYYQVHDIWWKLVSFNFFYGILKIVCLINVVKIHWKLIIRNTAKRNMSSAVCALSMYSRLCMKMSPFLSVHAWAIPRTIFGLVYFWVWHSSAQPFLMQ